MFSHLWQDGDHGEGRLGLDGSFGVEEGTCLWPLYGLVLLGLLRLSILGAPVSQMCDL